jgi:asparagine synthase (glutamine-hydrolysing)
MPCLPHAQRKGLLRQLARKHLPSEIIDRPKQGFAIPIGDWFRTDYGQMKQLLLDHLNAPDPWPNINLDLNRRFVAQMLDEHMHHKRDHSQRLYMLLVLSIWAKSLK